MLNKMKKLVLILAVGGVCSLTTCTSDVYSPDACFTEDVLTIFVSNCAFSGCHDAASHEEDYDLTTYEGIMKGITPKHPQQSEIYREISGANPSMPESPYPKLSKKDLNTIKIWIKMGAPNSSNCRLCDTVDFTYNTRVKKTMDTWCVGCHTGASAGGGLDLTTYTGVAAAVTGNRLVGSLNHTAGFSPMPKNAGKISQCDIDAIERWVNAGYPNN